MMRTANLLPWRQRQQRHCLRFWGGMFTGSLLVAVVAGTTLGMMIANVPAVLLGDRIAARMPVKLVHGIAAAIFLGLGIATLAGAGESLGF